MWGLVQWTEVDWAQYYPWLRGQSFSFGGLRRWTTTIQRSFLETFSQWTFPIGVEAMACCGRHLKQRTRNLWLTWRNSWKQWELSLKDVSKAKGDFFYLTCIGLLSPHLIWPESSFHLWWALVGRRNTLQGLVGFWSSWPLERNEALTWPDPDWWWFPALHVPL